MTYTRGGRPLKQGLKGNVLIVEDMSMEGFLIKTFTKTGTVPKVYAQIRNGIKVAITKEEFQKIEQEQKEARSKK